MAQTAAHLADRVIPPVPVRQWVVSIPKRLRGFLADRPQAVAALTKIFLAEIERTLLTASGVTSDADAQSASRPRLGAVSFLHRFGSALNHHVHLHACVTDGVFMPSSDATTAFLPARPVTAADLAALTERVRRRVIRWFRLTRLLDAAAAADMLAWENSGFSIDASVRITLLDRDVPSYFQSLEHLLRYCARPPFALERLVVIRGADGRIARIRYVVPRHWIILWAATWVGPGRKRKSTQPGANGVIELAPFEFLDRLADLIPPPRKHRHRPAGGWHGGRGHGWPCRRKASPGSSRRITRCGRPSRRWRSGGDWLVFRRNRCLSPAAGQTGQAPTAAQPEPVPPTTPPGSLGRNSWPGWGRSFPSYALGCGGDIRLRGDGRQEPAHYEPEVRKRKKAGTAIPSLP
jgi:hypothetical protein